jgi:hypothetical protein
MKKNVIQMFIILIIFVMLLMVLQVLRFGSPLPSGYVTYVDNRAGGDSGFSEGYGRAVVMAFSATVLVLAVAYLSRKYYISRKIISQ